MLEEVVLVNEEERVMTMINPPSNLKGTFLCSIKLPCSKSDLRKNGGFTMESTIFMIDIKINEGSRGNSDMDKSSKARITYRIKRHLYIFGEINKTKLFEYKELRSSDNQQDLIESYKLKPPWPIRVENNYFQPIRIQLNLIIRNKGYL